VGNVVYMLITHMRSKELIGKKVYAANGRLLGEVAGIAGRRGTLHALVLRKPARSRSAPQTGSPGFRP
jgi:sporulation protein YlmC with PRC-barrel domain